MKLSLTKENLLTKYYVNLPEILDNLVKKCK